MGDDLGEGRRHVELHVDGDELAVLERHGEMPLPPYITETARRPRALPDGLRRSGRGRPPPPPPGCTSPPTVLARLAERGRRPWPRSSWSSGLGTFRPDRHRRGRGPRHAHRAVPGAGRDHGRPACAPGPPAGGSSPWAPPRCGRWRAPRSRGELEGRTDLFITPGYEFRLVDRMLTNFHLPRSSLLVMVEAFVGPAVARPLRHRPRRGLPLPVLRRRHAAGAGDVA